MQNRTHRIPARPVRKVKMHGHHPGTLSCHWSILPAKPIILAQKLFCNGGANHLLFHPIHQGHIAVLSRSSLSVSSLSSSNRLTKSPTPHKRRTNSLVDGAKHRRSRSRLLNGNHQSCRYSPKLNSHKRKR